MKTRGKKVIAAWMVLLLFGLAACGSQNGESTMPNDVGEQSSVSEQPTENPAESPMTDLADNTAEAGVESSDGEESSKPVREKSVKELLKTFTVEGCSLPIPCQVKDMGEGLSLGEGATLIGGTTCELMYEGRWLGNVTLPEVELETNSFVDMSTGYEDAWISAFNIFSSEGDFEISGVTFASTQEEIVALWGEPDVKTDEILSYYDYDEITGEKIAHITFDFYSNGKMMSIFIITK